MYGDSGFILDPNSTSLQWGTLVSPRDRNIAINMLMLMATPPSVLGLKKSVIRLNPVKKH